MRKPRSVIGTIAALAALLAGGCASLPSLEGREASTALPPAVDTTLARGIAPLAREHPALTGVHPLTAGEDAFAARIFLAHSAQRSIDAQYYIWHADETGLLMLEALRDAATRGVRVRLLLDDQNSRDVEPLLAALAALPRVEIRLYNPFANRGLRAAGYLGDFERLNRRMHNKAFVADGVAAIVGGRNIGNEYFGAGEAIPFKDLDVVAIGAVVPEVSAEFDRYWNSGSAYPASSILGAPPADAGARLDERFATMRASPATAAYEKVVREATLVAQLLERRVPFEWAKATVVADDPSKTLDREARTDVLLLGRLLDGGVRPQATFDMITPYFVPGARGTEALVGLAARGVRVRVLTNSLGATDVAVVHSGYAKRRCALARGGVRLYEMKPSIAAGDDARRKGGGSGSSSARLHAKTFAADGQRIFVGSFNFDPRSALLNTEMGLVIDSPALARRLAATFDDVVPPNAFEVRPVEGEACVEWIERSAAGEVRHDTEPNASWGRRAWLQFLMALPLDPML